MILRRYTCRTVRNMLPLHVGGDLDPRHAPEVDRHLQDCLVCFREFRELGTMRSRLGVLAEEPLPVGILDGFTEEVMARIDVGEPGPVAEAPSPGPRQRISSFQRLSAAAAVLLVALAGWRAMTDQGRFGSDDAVIEMQQGLSGSVSHGTQVQPAMRPQGQTGWRLAQQPGPSATGFGASPTSQYVSSDDSSVAASADDMLDIVWPMGVPVETRIQMILRKTHGLAGANLNDQGSQASGLQRDDRRELRKRQP